MTSASARNSAPARSPCAWRPATDGFLKQIGKRAGAAFRYLLRSGFSGLRGLCRSRRQRLGARFLYEIRTLDRIEI
jgi:hypothetical protein